MATDTVTIQLPNHLYRRLERMAELTKQPLEGSRIEGRTSTGIATAETLRLNNDFIIVARQFWVEAGRWPPEDDL